MYNVMVRVLPAEQCVLSGSSPSQQKALLAPVPTSVGGLRELAREGNGLSQHLIHWREVAFLPSWISKCFQKVKSISLNLKPPRGRDEPGITCLWLETRQARYFGLCFDA